MGVELPVHILEEYIFPFIVLHFIEALQRTWDMKLAIVNSSGPRVLNLAISGLILITFWNIHLLKFCFGYADQFDQYFF